MAACDRHDCRNILHFERERAGAFRPDQCSSRGARFQRIKVCRIVEFRRDAQSCQIGLCKIPCRAIAGIRQQHALSGPDHRKNCKGIRGLSGGDKNGARPAVKVCDLAFQMPVGWRAVEPVDVAIWPPCHPPRKAVGIGVANGRGTMDRDCQAVIPLKTYRYRLQASCSLAHPWSSIFQRMIDAQKRCRPISFSPISIRIGYK